MKLKKTPKLALVFYLIIFIGLIIRLFYVSQIQSLWGDEAANFFHAKEPLSILIKGDYFGFASHPPLSFIIFKFWTLISNDEKWLRLLGTITSILSIFVVGAITKELFPKKKYILVILAFIFAISTYQIRLGAELRYVNLCFLFLSACLYFFLRVIRGKSSVLYSCIFGILAMFTDYSYFWLWLSMVFYALIILVKYLKGDKTHVPLLKVFICIVVPALVFLPWLPKFLHNLDFPFYSGYISKPQIIDIPALLLSYLISFPTEYGISAQSYHFWKPLVFLVRNENIVKAIYLILSNSLLIAVIFKLIQFIRSNPELFMKISMMIPVIASYIFSQKNPIFVDYNLQIVSIGLMIMLAAFISDHKKMGVIVLILYTFLNFLSLKVLFQFEAVKENWNAIISHAKDALGTQKSLILIYPNVNIFPVKYYYQTFNLDSRISLLELDKSDVNKGEYENNLSQYNYQKVCLVTNTYSEGGYDLKIKNYLTFRYDSLNRLDTYGIYIQCFKLKNYEKET